MSEVKSKSHRQSIGSLPETPEVQSVVAPPAAPPPSPAFRGSGSSPLKTAAIKFSRAMSTDDRDQQEKPEPSIHLEFMEPEEGTPAARALAANAAIKVSKLSRGLHKVRGMKRPKMKSLNLVKKFKKTTKKRRRKKHFSKNFKGKVIDGVHELYTLTAGMMLGIRYTVANAASMSRDDGLLLNDFSYIEKVAFPPSGNPSGPHVTPAHKLAHTFKFKTYAPKVFHRLRDFFDIDAESYMASVCGDYNFIEFISNSKSGQFFFYSHDGHYMLKTQTKEENRFMKRILPHYYQYLTENPHSLLVRILGMHRVKMYHLRRKVHFVIMTSVFDTPAEINRIYDLKGSMVGREASQKERDSGGVLKDIDLLKDKCKFHFGPKKAAFMAQLKRDAEFLAKMNIMDYSLLVGIHSRTSRSTNLVTAIQPQHINTSQSGSQHFHAGHHHPPSGSPTTATAALVYGADGEDPRFEPPVRSSTGDSVNSVNSSGAPSVGGSASAAAAASASGVGLMLPPTPYTGGGGAQMHHRHQHSNTPFRRSLHLEHGNLIGNYSSSAAASPDKDNTLAAHHQNRADASHVSSCYSSDTGESGTEEHGPAVNSRASARRGSRSAGKRRASSGNTHTHSRHKNAHSAQGNNNNNNNNNNNKSSNNGSSSNGNSNDNNNSTQLQQDQRKENGTSAAEASDSGEGGRATESAAPHDPAQQQEQQEQDEQNAGADTMPISINKSSEGSPNNSSSKSKNKTFSLSLDIEAIECEMSPHSITVGTTAATAGGIDGTTDSDPAKQSKDASAAEHRPNARASRDDGGRNINAGVDAEDDLSSVDEGEYVDEEDGSYVGEDDDDFDEEEDDEDEDDEEEDDEFYDIDAGDSDMESVTVWSAAATTGSVAGSVADSNDGPKQQQQQQQKKPLAFPPTPHPHARHGHSGGHVTFQIVNPQRQQNEPHKLRSGYHKPNTPGHAELVEEEGLKLTGNVGRVLSEIIREDGGLMSKKTDKNAPTAPIYTYGPGMARRHPWTSRRDEGINSRNSSDQRGDEIYYLGIIDILQQYNASKRVETAAKSFTNDSRQISSVNANYYAKRFIEFMDSNID